MQVYSITTICAVVLSVSSGYGMNLPAGIATPSESKYPTNLTSGLALGPVRPYRSGWAPLETTLADMAKKTGNTLSQEDHDEIKRQIIALFAISTTRAPTPSELRKVAVAFDKLRLKKKDLFIPSEFIYMWLNGEALFYERLTKMSLEHRQEQQGTASQIISDLNFLPHVLERLTPNRYPLFRDFLKKWASAVISELKEFTLDEQLLLLASFSLLVDRSHQAFDILTDPRSQKKFYIELMEDVAKPLLKALSDSLKPYFLVTFQTSPQYMTGEQKFVVAKCLLALSSHLGPEFMEKLRMTSNLALDTLFDLLRLPITSQQIREQAKMLGAIRGVQGNTPGPSSPSSADQKLDQNQAQSSGRALLWNLFTLEERLSILVHYRTEATELGDDIAQRLGKELQPHFGLLIECYESIRPKLETLSPEDLQRVFSVIIFLGEKKLDSDPDQMDQVKTWLKAEFTHWLGYTSRYFLGVSPALMNESKGAGEDDVIYDGRECGDFFWSFETLVEEFGYRGFVDELDLLPVLQKHCMLLIATGRSSLDDVDDVVPSLVAIKQAILEEGTGAAHGKFQKTNGKSLQTIFANLLRLIPSHIVLELLSELPRELATLDMGEVNPKPNREVVPFVAAANEVIAKSFTSTGVGPVIWNTAWTPTMMLKLLTAWIRLSEAGLLGSRNVPLGEWGEKARILGNEFSAGDLSLIQGLLKKLESAKAIKNPGFYSAHQSVTKRVAEMLKEKKSPTLSSPRDTQDESPELAADSKESKSQVSSPVSFISESPSTGSSRNESPSTSDIESPNTSPKAATQKVVTPKVVTPKPKRVGAVWNTSLQKGLAARNAGVPFREHFSQASELGSVQAMVYLGWMNEKGIEGRINFREALRLYLGAEQNLKSDEGKSQNVARIRFTLGAQPLLIGDFLKEAIPRVQIAIDDRRAQMAQREERNRIIKAERERVESEERVNAENQAQVSDVIDSLLTRVEVADTLDSLVSGVSEALDQKAITELLRKADGLLREATEHENEGDLQQATSVYTLAIPALQKAAEAGSAYANLKLGQLFFLGKGAAVQFSLAREHFEKAADLKLASDNPENIPDNVLVKRAQRAAGIMYLNFSTPNRKNLNQGVQLLLKAAKGGDGISAYLLGDCYRRAKMFAKAFKYFKMAVSLGSSFGLTRMAQLHKSNVPGVPFDTQLAGTLMSRAAGKAAPFNVDSKADSKGDAKADPQVDTKIDSAGYDPEAMLELAKDFELRYASHASQKEQTGQPALSYDFRLEQAWAVEWYENAILAGRHNQGLSPDHPEWRPSRDHAILFAARRLSSLFLDGHWGGVTFPIAGSKDFINSVAFFRDPDAYQKYRNIAIWQAQILENRPKPAR